MYGFLFGAAFAGSDEPRWTAAVVARAAGAKLYSAEAVVAVADLACMRELGNIASSFLSFDENLEPSKFSSSLQAYF